MTIQAKQQDAAASFSRKKHNSSSKQQRLDAPLVEKAVRALLQHHQTVVAAAEKQPLLGADVPVQLLLGLEVAPRAARPKPIRLTVPHPLHKLGDGDDDGGGGVEEPEVCLIVKEESKPAVQEMIADFPEHLKCIKKVLGLQSLRQKHASYQQRRDLLARYDVFLADDRILPMLQSALGKHFVQAKRLPVPVRVTRREALPFAIRKALSCTYLHLSRGTCLNVRVGHTGMPVPHLVDNIAAATAGAVARGVPRHWANVRSVAVKLPASQALPVYNKTPAELQEIATLAGLPSAWRSSADEEEPESNDAVNKEEEGAEAETETAGKKKKQTKKAPAALEKSPLLRALKKQKKLESENVDHDGDAKKEEPSSKTKAKPDDKKSKKKRDRKEATKGEDDDDTDDDAPEEPQPQPPASKKSKNKKDEGAQDDDDAASPKSPAKRQKTSIDNSEPEPFIASKKFRGSKPKYVFKMDGKGLGYYLDAPPPVPVKVALQALARMAQKRQQSQGAGGSSGKKKSKGKRGGRR